MLNFIILLTKISDSITQMVIEPLLGIIYILQLNTAKLTLPEFEVGIRNRIEESDLEYNQKPI